jgi:hypothetical protein
MGTVLFILDRARGSRIWAQRRFWNHQDVPWIAVRCQHCRPRRWSARTDQAEARSARSGPGWPAGSLLQSSVRIRCARPRRCFSTGTAAIFALFSCCSATRRSRAKFVVLERTSKARSNSRKHHDLTVARHVRYRTLLAGLCAPSTRASSPSLSNSSLHEPIEPLGRRPWDRLGCRGAALATSLFPATRRPVTSI